jgi:hypothetical protein
MDAATELKSAALEQPDAVTLIAQAWPFHQSSEPFWTRCRACRR